MKLCLVLLVSTVLLCQHTTLSSPTRHRPDTRRGVQSHPAAGQESALAPLRTSARNVRSRHARQAGGCSCLAYVYDHANFQGRRLAISQQNADFTNDFFNDRIESIQLLGTCKWLFYTHTNFMGDEHHPSHLLSGSQDYASPPNWGPADMISSARALPPEHTTSILLFDHINYQGRMLALYTSSNHLPSLDFSDHISSVIVTGGHWTLFQHTNFTGISQGFGVGEYSNIHLEVVGGDSVSSVRRD